MQTQISISTHGKGLYEISTEIEHVLKQNLNNSDCGLLHCFVLHTSCSLIIQENADPSAKADIEEYFDRIAPENQSWHRHTLEGPDDTTSHLKSAITHTSLSVPVTNGALNLGTWQGIYLFEHRKQSHNRKLILSFLKI